ARARLVFPMCHYSLVSQPPGQLAFLQRVPHIDSAASNGLATVHYLFHGDWGGTAFYRHRATRHEYVDESRHAGYFATLQEEAQRGEAGQDGYINGDSPLFEQVDSVPGV